MIDVIPEVRAVVCYASIIVATAVIVGNGAIMLNILYWKTLRKKHAYKLIACHCCGYIIIGLGIWSKDVFNLYMFHNSTRKFTQYACRMHCLVFMLGFTSIVDFYLLGAMDRCVAVISPRIYTYSNRWWWLFIQLTTTILHSVYFLHYIILLTSDKPISTCTVMSSVEGTSTMPLLPGFAVEILLTMLLYVALLIWTKLSIKKFSNNRVPIGIMRSQLKWQLMMTLFISACAYFSTIFLSIMSSLLINVAPENRIYISILSITGNLVNLSGILNVLILFKRLKDIRTTIQRLLQLKTNSVNTTTVQPITNYSTAYRRFTTIVKLIRVTK